jgi:pyruvate/2-oxoglutarate dehydrogenase complex dihydrolipoamide dehydrogenase (E3) component
MTVSYDLIVIGAGSAGLTPAKFGSQLGLKVALVEKGRLGGDYTWNGCVPSKTILKIAQAARQVSTAQRFGIGSGGVKTDWGKVIAHVKGVAEEIYAANSRDLLTDENITIVEGPASFADPYTVLAGDSVLTGERILITTGAGRVIPPIPGLAETGFLTYRTI